MPPTACPVLESERSPSFQGERGVLVRHGSLERLDVGKRTFCFCRRHGVALGDLAELSAFRLTQSPAWSTGSISSPSVVTSHSQRAAGGRPGFCCLRCSRRGRSVSLVSRRRGFEWWPLANPPNWHPQSSHASRRSLARLSPSRCSTEPLVLLSAHAASLVSQKAVTAVTGELPTRPARGAHHARTQTTGCHLSCLRSSRP
jgi:hypothetical protein